MPTTYPKAKNTTPIAFGPSHGIANMLLPSELIDYIFSFLEGDIQALKECSNTHPFLSRLAERYLYADIVLTADSLSKFYKRLSNNPHILQYPRTLEIQANATVLPNVLSMIVATTIPQMANLKTLKLCERQPGSRLFFDRSFLLTLFEEYLQQSSIEQVVLARFLNFPFSVLNSVKNIKKLTLIDCPTLSESPHKILLVETLILRDHSFVQSVQLPNLKSLQLPDVMRAMEWDAVPGLVTACSNSLTSLHFHVDDYGLMSSFSHTTLPYQKLLTSFPDAIPSGRGYWLYIYSEFPFTLSTHKRLKHLSILTPVRTIGSSTQLVVSSAFPAIINLIKTAPAIQDIVLYLHWANSGPSFLGVMDWSLLLFGFPAIRPPVHLVISGDTDGHSISPECILEVLTENEELMDLVERKVVTLTAERNESLGD